jgi:hypothetical protein
MDRTIIVRLEPTKLDNPDLDLRYAIPDEIAERSGGLIESEGYGYAEGSDLLLLFLGTADLKPALDCVLDVIVNVRLLENDLRKGTVVAVETGEGDRVVYPPDFAGTFTR